MSLTTSRDLTGELTFLARELKTPVITATFSALGDQARAEGWSHEEYLAAVLGRQVASRTANGTRMRISAAHFPATKTLEDFSFTDIPPACRDVIAHLGTTTFIARRENVVLLGPPGTGKRGRPTRPGGRCSAATSAGSWPPCRRTPGRAAGAR